MQSSAGLSCASNVCAYRNQLKRETTLCHAIALRSALGHFRLTYKCGKKKKCDIYHINYTSKQNRGQARNIR